MTVWIWREGVGLVEKAPAPRAAAPQVMPDLPGYRSPLGSGWIEGRAARREDLKRGNCREVDPGEFRPAYHNERFARRHGLPHTPSAPRRPIEPTFSF